MFFKFVGSLILLVAIANAIKIQHHTLVPTYQTVHAIQKTPVLIKSHPVLYQPIHVQEVESQKHEEEGPIEYTYSYEVNDKKTGDIKSVKESRKDNKVEGSYELIDSDGYRRLVQYTADDHNGFQAVVLREPTDIKIPIPEPKKVEQEAPQIILKQKILKPIVHYAPVRLTKLIHSSEPIQQYHVLTNLRSSEAPKDEGESEKVVEQEEEEKEEKAKESGSNHVSFSGSGISYKY